MEQFDTLNLRERLFKIERRGQQLSILVIVLAALLGLSILRDILHETGVDVTALVSRITSSQSLEGSETQATPLVTHEENALGSQTNYPQ